MALAEPRDRHVQGTTASAKVPLRGLVTTARPGRIKDVLDVQQVFGRPRVVEDVKSSPQYGELFSRVWGQLRDEVQAAREL